jgi:uncharacterized membrane protein
MSVVEEFENLEQRVRSRLRELEPLVIEYEGLKKVAERLGISSGSGEGGSTRRRRGRSASTTRSSRSTGGGALATRPRRSPAATRTRGSAARATARKRRPAGERQQQVLEAVQRQPGVTVAEIGKQLGTDPTALYRVVKRLESEGQIRKEGPQLHPAA